MNTYTVYTRLKNADLACLSAKTAIEQYLHYDKLADLQRYTKWMIQAETLDIRTLKSILDNSYYIANPNKETASTDELPAHSKWTQYHAEVRSSNASSDDEIRRKINETFGTKIHSVSHSTLWCLFVDQAHSDDLQSELETLVVNTSSQSQGLLANPLYEEVAFSHYLA